MREAARIARSGELGAVQSAGGLLNAGGIADLVHVTIADNIASGSQSGLGGGIRVQAGTANLRNSIVSGNRFGSSLDPGECAGAITSLDYNRIGARSTCVLTGALAHVNTVDLLGSLLFEPAFTGGFAETIGPQEFLTKVIPPESCVDALGAQLEVDGRGLWRDPAADCDIGAVASRGSYRPASPIGVELIRNGGAAVGETGIAAVDPSSVHPPFWELTSGETTQALYGAFAGFPLRSDAPPGSGSYFFTGGPSGDSVALQRIDIGAASAEIDAGGLDYTIAGAFGGFEADEDSAQLLVSFQDLADNVLLEVVIGGFTATDRGNETKLIADSATGTIPIGTRILVATLSATRPTNADYNDGSADALSIVIPEPATALGGLGAIAALALLARRSSKRS